MKFFLVVAAFAGLTGAALADEMRGPSTLTDAQMDQIVAGDFNANMTLTVFIDGNRVGLPLGCGGWQCDIYGVRAIWMRIRSGGP